MLKSRLTSWAIIVLATWYVLSVGAVGRAALALLVLTLSALSYGVWLGYRYALSRLDELDLEHQRDGGVGDYVLDLRLESQVRKLRQQLAGLLASPRLYVRARRLLAPTVPLERDDITAELEVLGEVEATPILQETA